MKRLLLVFLGSFLTLSSWCQHMTLQVGPSISHLEWTHSANSKTLFSIPNTSVNVLIGKNYIPLKYFFLNSSVGYIQKGGKDSLVVGPEGYSGDPIAKVQMHYITVNTTANVQFPIKDKVFPFLSLGPRLDYLIGYNENVSVLLPYDTNGELDRLIYGLITGGGVNFKVKRLMIGAIFSYYFNFNKIINYTQPYSENHSELIDRTFTVNVTMGYLF